MIKLFYGTLPGTVFLNFNAIYAQNRTVPSTGKVIEETRGDPINSQPYCWATLLAKFQLQKRLRLKMAILF